MTVSPLLRPLGIAASILGLGQGLAWSVLSLLVILIHTRAWEPEHYDLTTHPQRLAAYLNLMYAQEYDWLGLSVHRIVTNAVFFGLSWFYLVASFVWMVVSLCQLWVLFRQKDRYVRHAVLAWASLTGLITIFDIVITCLFITDYDYVVNESMPDLVVTTVGVMMTIVARGFGFLLINAILFVVLLTLALKTNGQNVGKPNQPRPFLSAHQAGGNPWHTTANGGDPRQPGGGIPNTGFDGGPNPQTPRDVSSPYNFIPAQQSQRFSYLSAPLQNGTQGGYHQNSGVNLLPKVSKSNVPPRIPTDPYISTPDYSPPTSPLQQLPGSVLNNRTLY